MGLDDPRGYRLRKLAAQVLPKKTTERLERRIRERKFEEYELSELNELLFYNIQEEFPDEIAIHVHEILTKSPHEMRRLAIDGLKKLAAILERDPKLANITSVTGHSNIVFTNPKLAEQFGFTIEERDHEEEHALARMLRGEFLARYGSGPNTNE